MRKRVKRTTTEAQRRVVNTFRSLNEEERTALAQLHEKKVLPRGVRSENIKVSYTLQDNFTIALVMAFVNGSFSLYVGSSKRNPTDRTNPLTGHMNAFTRALRYKQVTSLAKAINAPVIEMTEDKEQVEAVMSEVVETPIVDPTNKRTVGRGRRKKVEQTADVA